jgi:hypothetical protein
LIVADDHIFQFEVLYNCNIGAMLQKALIEANEFFKENNMDQRFEDDPKLLLDESLFEIYMAKKSGLPKTGYPGISTNYSLNVIFL